jgi:serine/threonine protein kinase
MVRRLVLSAEDNKAAAFLEQEAPITKHLRNEPIAGVRTPDSTFSTVEGDKEVQYLVFEGTYGTDLASFFQGSSVDSNPAHSLDIIQTLFSSICHIFEECHNRGLAVGTLKLASVFFAERVDGMGNELAVLSLPRTTEVCPSGSNNNHHNMSLSPNARVAFGNDIVILGYILGYMLTGSRPNIRTLRSYSQETHVWLRQSCIEFPNLESIKLPVRRILESCVNTTPTQRPTVDLLLTHSALRCEPRPPARRPAVRAAATTVTMTAAATTAPATSVSTALSTAPTRSPAKRTAAARAEPESKRAPRPETSGFNLSIPPLHIQRSPAGRVEASGLTAEFSAIPSIAQKAANVPSRSDSESSSAPSVEDSVDVSSVSPSARSSPELTFKVTTTDAQLMHTVSATA